MRCRTCDYPLWNLPTRVCPECGTAFKPSDFHFVPNSVRFCCQHCEQQYYGTTPEGHLIPRTFNCVKCGQRIDMDEMVLRPAEGVEETRTSADVMPWLERQRIGWLRGWWRTVIMAMVAPQRLMKALPTEAGTGAGWLFAVLTHSLIFACAMLPIIVIGLISVVGSGGRAAAGGALPMAFFMLCCLAGTLLFIVLWGLISHGLLAITGGTEHRMARTYQAILYSGGANLVCGVPCLGMYFGWLLWIWWLVSAILMAMQAQRVKGLRATLCVGLPPIAVMMAGVIGFFLFMMAMTRGITAVSMSSAGAGGYSPYLESQAIGSGLLSYAQQHNGQGPPHALQLVADNSVAAANFVVWQIGHDEANVPVADTTLGAFQLLGPNRMQMAAQAAASALPPNVIAHRMGDVVLTYHGIDLRNADPRLWIAIICPDPSQPISPGSGLVATAVQADGAAVPLTPSITAALQRQNALRAQYNLPPLPDPATVLHSQPATRPVSNP